MELYERDSATFIHHSTQHKIHYSAGKNETTISVPLVSEICIYFRVPLYTTEDLNWNISQAGCYVCAGIHSRLQCH